MKTLLITLLATLSLTACDQPAQPQGDADDRGTAAGKADGIEGSCAPESGQSQCGGPAPIGNCWCDDTCEQWGDCCEDAFDQCGVGPEPEPSCDDGTAVHPLCDTPGPCDEGTVQAVQSGCFRCVDPSTCEPPEAPEPEAPSCDDGTPVHPLCDTPGPCDEGTIRAVQNGCFRCVDPSTCA